MEGIDNYCLGIVGQLTIHMGECRLILLLQRAETLNNPILRDIIDGE